MNEATGKTADDLKQKLSQHIDAAKTKLEALKKDLVGIHQEDVKTLQQRREQIRQRVDEQKESARKMREDIAAWTQEKKAHTQEAIGSWRRQRQVDKLEARAERAGDYAVEMVNVAVYDFDEAEQAILEAIAARYDAEQAAANPA
jgi:hypothetical protein